MNIFSEDFNWKEFYEYEPVGCVFTIVVVLFVAIMSVLVLVMACLGT